VEFLKAEASGEFLIDVVLTPGYHAASDSGSGGSGLHRMGCRELQRAL